MKVNQNTDLRSEINSLDFSAIFSFFLDLCGCLDRWAEEGELLLLWL